MDTHHPGAYPASLIPSTMDHTLFTLTNILAANQYLPWGHSGTRGLCKSYTNFFPLSSFCLGWILGLFLQNWRIIGVFVIIRRVHIMVATSVK